MGRFLTPDPYKANNGASGDPANPQSWNRYAYSLGDPVNLYDPQGLVAAAPSSSSCGYMQIPDGFGGCMPAPIASGTLNDVAIQIAQNNSVRAQDDLHPNPQIEMKAAITDAVMRASDRIFNADCAGLFLAPGANTIEQRQILSGQLQLLSNRNLVRLVDKSQVPANVPAFTTATYGYVYVAIGGAFFSGKTADGKSLGGGFQGLSVNQSQQLMMIHEFLHWEGIGADNANQRIQLANGNVVTGSGGISEEVRKKCF